MSVDWSLCWFCSFFTTSGPAITGQPRGPDWHLEVPALDRSCVWSERSPGQSGCRQVPIPAHWPRIQALRPLQVQLQALWKLYSCPRHGCTHAQDFVCTHSRMHTCACTHAPPGADSLPPALALLTPVESCFPGASFALLPASPLPTLIILHLLALLSPCLPGWQITPLTKLPRESGGGRRIFFPR